ncbi:MAG: hypothetical protein U0324_07225 [Polyangiales bacterium]
MVCNTTSGRCVDCNTTADCVTGQLCVANRCFTPERCTSSRMCPGRVCSVRLGYCVDCDADVDCPGGSVCRENVCAPQAGACRLPRDCSGATPVCDTAQGRCVACVAAMDCPVGQTCRMNACVPRVCVPDSVRCPDGGRERTVCASDGLSVRTEACPQGANATNARCATGDVCAFDCRPGFGDCDRAEANGCEADLTASAANCGACGRACATGQRCVTGECRVPAGPTTRYVLAEVPAGEPYVAACMQPGAVRELRGSDDVYVLLALPFALRFWNVDLAAGTNVTWTTNGFLTMNEARAALMGLEIPSHDFPDGVVAPYASDTFNVGDQCAAVVGAAPSRRWVLEWPDSYNCCVRPPTMRALTYEVVFHEGTNVIDFRYAQREGARASTIGLESPDGALAVSPCGAGMRCVPTRDYRFLPVP